MKLFNLFLVLRVISFSNLQTIPDGQGGYIYPHDDRNWFSIVPIIGCSWEF
ncbi:hypothetical protein KJ762_09650 [bacterium]|nr:hypothetical protein [bacterium]MBU1063384.1 hypothetical protein [bacterium]MBU1634757.1 hypothetical protein [bacterium]MBU1874462.1 hypothetical protein [bacterium]